MYMQVSPFGRFFFLIALLLLIVSIVAFVKDGILKGALWLGAAALCWFIGFYHDVRLFKRGELFSERYPEKFPKNEVYKNAMIGVGMVRAGLSYYLLPECEANFSKDYSYTLELVAAVVNLVFSASPSNGIGKRFIENEDNLNNVKLVIEKVIKPQEKLKQIITDTVRVQCFLSHAMTPKLSETDFYRLCVEPIDNLKHLGLFIPGGEMPVLSIFLHNAATFLQACKADLDQQ